MTVLETQQSQENKESRDSTETYKKKQGKICMFKLRGHRIVGKNEKI